LDRVGGLTPDDRQVLLEGRFDLPEMSRLPNPQRPIPPLGEEMPIVGPRVSLEVWSVPHLKYSPPISRVMTSASVSAWAKPRDAMDKRL
jgi:hypothetical protein